MTKRDFILSLIRAGLWQQQVESFPMDVWHYQESLQETEKQSVMGLLADALERNCEKMTRNSVKHLLRVRGTLAYENRRFNDNVVELSKLMEENHIGFAVVKGQVLGALYPNPELRMPGDIDFYVIQKDFDRAVMVLNQHWELSLDTSIKGMHLEFKKNGIVFEMHRLLLSFPHEETRRDFHALVESFPFEPVEINGYPVPTLMPTLNVFYTFLHLYNHLVKLGVAIRQLCDVAVLLHHYKDRIDRELLAKWMEAYDFKRAFAAVGHVLVDKLGLPSDEFPMEITQNDMDNGEKILDLVWTHGKWGMYERDFGKKGSIKYYLNKINVRVSSQRFFQQLSPKFSKSILYEETPRKVYSAMVSKVKKMGNAEQNQLPE